MTPYNVFELYSALRLHFTTASYNFFKYSGKTNVTPAKYNNVNESIKRAFSSIAQLAEPKTYLVGNMMFSDSKFIRDFTDDNYLRYRKYLVGGDYFLAQDVAKLRLPLKANFSVAHSQDAPYILQLYAADEISLYTACALNKLTNWSQSISRENSLFQSQKLHVEKSQDFFKIDTTKSKQIIIDLINKK